MAMRMVVDDDPRRLGDRSASPGLAYVKWENPVRAGDALRVTVEVLERRVAQSKPTLGIVRWRWRLTNQRDGSPSSTSRRRASSTSLPRRLERERARVDARRAARR